MRLKSPGFSRGEPLKKSFLLEGGGERVGHGALLLRGESETVK